MIWFQYAVFFVTSFVVSWVVSTRITKRFEAAGIVDLKSLPDKRIPTAGGTAIAVSFLLVVGISTLFYPEGMHTTTKTLVGLLVASLMIAGLGFYDDVKGARPLIKLAVQVLAASILVYAGLAMEEVTNPFSFNMTGWGESFELGSSGNLILIAWIVVLTNAVNVIDGLDGLAAGICLISAVTMFAISHIFGEVTLAALSIVLAGSIFGFIRLNLPPAKIYLGDTGSLFLGFVLAAIAVTERRKGSVTITLLVPVLVAAVPVIDIIYAFFRRLINRKNPFKGDTLHIHHRLVAFGLTPEQVNRMIFLLCVYLGINAGVLAFFSKETTIIVMLLLTVGLILAIEFLRSLPVKQLPEEESDIKTDFDTAE
jgi:UDP-GlcNAc:undecaprenyl-phosphate GlcNAc-1-phosphate transferase